MPSFKLDLKPLGSPELNFVLGPSAVEIQAKKTTNAAPSMFEKHTKVAADEKIPIKHIQNGGPTIYVTNKRVNRILKRRKKRVQFLIDNPEFSLPYKFRSKGPKHQSRSKSAKGRVRKGDGRFAKAGRNAVDFTVDMNDPTISNPSGHDQNSDIVRTRL